MEISNKAQSIKITQLQAIAADRGVDRQAGETPDLSPDKVSFSEQGIRKAEFLKILEVVKKSPDIDRERVAALQQAIADGSYTPDLSKVAERMIEEDLSFPKL